MAYIVGELAAPITVDTKAFDQGLADAKRKGENWASETGAAFTKAGKGMDKLGSKMTKSITLPIIAAGTAMITTATNFEASMNRVRGLTGAAGAEFEKLKDQARDLGATTQYTASEAGDAMGFLALAGFKVNEIVGAMPSVLELAASAQMDLGGAADITSNILKGYGKNVEELGHVNDVLVKAMTTTNVDLQMLGESLKYVGPVANGVGLEFEEVAGAIGLMGNAGIQGSMSGTSLRQAITALVNPTKQAKDIMRQFGITATDSSGKMRPLVDIVRDLEQSGATAADMMALFGQRAGPAMVALVEQGADALEDLTGKLQDSEGAAKAIAAVNMEGAKGAFLELKSAAEEFFLAVADSGILGQITSLAKGAGEWFREMAKTNPELLKTGVNIALVAAAAGPLISTTGKISKGIGGILTLVGKLTPSVTKLTNETHWSGITLSSAGSKMAALAGAAGPIALTVAVIGGLTAAFVLLGKHVDEQTKSIERQVEERFAKASYEAAEKVTRMHQEVSDEFTGMTDDVMGSLLNLRIGATEVSEETYQGIVASVEDMRSKAVEKLEQYKSEGLATLQSYYTDLGQLESDEYAQAVADLEAHYGIKIEKVGDAYNDINQIISSAMAEGRAVTQEEWQNIQGIFDTATDTVVDKSRWLEGQLAAVNADISEDAKKSAKTRAEKTLEILQNYHDDELAEITAQSDKRIEEILTAYARGEIATKEELDKQLALVKAHELEVTKEATAAHVERLKEQQWALDEMGKVIDEGSGNVISRWTAFWKSVKDESEAFMADLNERGKDGYYGAAYSGWQAYVQGTEDQMPAVEGAAQDVTDAIREKLARGKGDAFAAGKEVSAGVAGGIRANAKVAIGAAAELGGQISSAFRASMSISSPSRVMEEDASWIPEGVAKGILGGLGVIKGAVGKMADVVHLPFSQGAQQLAGAGGGNTVPININVYGPVTQETIPKIASAAGDAVGRAISRRGVEVGY